MIYVKLLNGDLLEIEHLPSKGFHHFVQKIYDACPEIPYGCIVLKRMNNDEEVSQVYTNDDLFLFVDTSLVRPVVEKGGEVYCIENGNENILVQFHINFFSKKYDPDWDEPYCYTKVDIFYDIHRHVYAIKNTFVQPTPQQCSCYNLPPYWPTEKTVWFSDPMDCLKSIENARFPRDEDTLHSISTQISEDLAHMTRFDRDDDDDD